MSDQIKVDFDVPATMRDGTILRANIFQPAEGGPYPIALTRTPYGKDFFSVSPTLDSIRLARAGYIVVIQDIRGRLTSDGEWVAMSEVETLDGYDSVEWAATLPNSSGKVGMFGLSYLGLTQWMAAKAQPPHLKAMIPFVTFADVRDGVSWRGGAMELGTTGNWNVGAVGLDIILKRYKNASPQERIGALMALVNEINQLRLKGYYSLPLKDFEPLRKLGLGKEVWEQIERPYDRELTAPASIATSYDKVTVPTYNVGGWYDIFTNGTLQNFRAMRYEGSTPEAQQAKVLIGPWSHVNYTNVVGEQDFGFASALAFMNLQTDLTGLTQRWFDYWLKGIENGITQEPPVKLFIMGANIWRDEQEWPLARTAYTPYYLHSDGSANSLKGDGALSTEKPTHEPADKFTYDPNNPVLTAGGNNLMNALFTPGVKNQTTTEERPDVLVYTTAPLNQDTEVIGPIVVKLWASSDATDTDFVARLVDVHSDGFAQNLADGIIRGRYRNGDTPELLEPGKAYEFTIDLWSTANMFKAGHSIRLDVTSSNFPRWDRNLNTGAAFGTDSEGRPAHQTILHDAEHPSQVILPLIPR